VTFLITGIGVVLIVIGFGGFETNHSIAVTLVILGLVLILAAKRVWSLEQEHARQRLYEHSLRERARTSQNEQDDEGSE
jgi:hypothetical protein